MVNSFLANDVFLTIEAKTRTMIVLFMSYKKSNKGLIYIVLNNFHSNYN